MVAVTGATGHIGNVLVRELLERGERVRVLIPDWDDPEPLADLAVERCPGDVRDPESLNRAFAEVQTVFHLAGIITISSQRRGLLEAVNVLGTRNVVRACLSQGVRRLVYTSSVHALVEPPDGKPVCEPEALEPERVVGAYGQSKARATIEVLKGGEQGLEVVIAFPSGVIGPYDFKGSEMGQLVLDFARQRLPAYVAGAYDFVDVRDVASALIAAARQGRAGEGYILSGHVITVAELMRLLERVTGKRAPKLKLPRWFALAVATLSPLWYALVQSQPRFTRYSLHVLGSNCLMDNRKARVELGLVPRPIEESITDSFQWFRKQGRL